MKMTQLMQADNINDLTTIYLDQIFNQKLRDLSFKARERSKEQSNLPAKVRVKIYQDELQNLLLDN